MTSSSPPPGGRGEAVRGVSATEDVETTRAMDVAAVVVVVVAAAVVF